MVDSYVGEIRLTATTNTNFQVPAGWLPCDGRLLQMSNALYQPLFALIGTTYGGNGATTFALPDFRGRLAVGQGTGTGLTARIIGQTFGTETVTLTADNVPSHTHTLSVATVTATAITPSTSVMFADTTLPTTEYVKTSTSGTVVNPSARTIGNNGLTPGAHENCMQSMPLVFIICFQGLYPQRAS